ncbi:MAG: hypothetical protein ACR2ID_07125 [Chthoniobacterales bacterium]
MADMKSFTVRQLDRETSRMMEACSVKIRRRDGRSYTLEADRTVCKISDLPDFAARMAKIFPKRINAAQTKLVDKLLAGE